MGDVFTPGPPRVPQTGRPFGSNGMAGAAPALIRFAYYVFGGDFDLRIDAPAWIKTARFDVEGTTKGSGEVSQVRSMAMLRHLLAERFALRVHCEAQVAQYDVGPDDTARRRLEVPLFAAGSVGLYRGHLERFVRHIQGGSRRARRLRA